MRLIDADEIVKVAKHAYNEWNLAMAAADGTREINKVFKMQELCKAMKAVADAAPTITPEGLVRHGRWEKVEDPGGGSHWMCSSCGTEWYFEADGPVENGCNYRPGCGDKLDLEDKPC